jgi:hypothetical protein
VLPVSIAIRITGTITLEVINRYRVMEGETAVLGPKRGWKVLR